MSCRQLAVISTVFFSLWCCSVFYGASPASTSSLDPNQALLILKSENFADTERLINSLEKLGVHAQHVIPPKTVIARVPPGLDDEVRALPGIALLLRDSVPPGLATADDETALGVKLWTQLKTQDASASAAEGVPLVGDALTPPSAPAVPRGAALRAAPDSGQTSEFMVGKVAVGVVLPESDGDSENWSLERQNRVFDEIVDGLNWWVTKGGNAAKLTFYYDKRFGVPTQYEPIKVSAEDDGLWIGDTLGNMGYTSGNWFGRAHDYANDLRNTLHTDWAYAFFVADSWWDFDGWFPGGLFAYAYSGGPVVVMTYDNGWPLGGTLLGIYDMHKVAAHETGHIFLAADEYCTPFYACCDCKAYGYLGIPNDNCLKCRLFQTRCMMNDNANGLCSESAQQLGWRDTDNDGKYDVIDNPVELTIDGTSKDQDHVRITGRAWDVPCPSPIGTACTINKITSVRWRIDVGDWRDAAPLSGTFGDSDFEEWALSFNASTIPAGQHTIEIQASSSSENVSAVLSQSLDAAPPVTTCTLTPQSTDGCGGWYVSEVRACLSAADDGSGVAGTEYNLDGSGWTAYSACLVVSSEGSHTLQYRSVDNAGNLENAKSVAFKIDLNAPVIAVAAPLETTYTHADSVTLDYSVTDTGSGVKSTESKLYYQDSCECDSTLTTMELENGQKIEMFRLGLDPASARLSVDTADNACRQASKVVEFKVISTIDSLIYCTGKCSDLKWITADGVRKSLAAKLGAARRSRDAGATRATAGILHAFRNELGSGLMNGKISRTAYCHLMQDARYVAEHIEAVESVK